jgi:WD40 repeat protein
MEHVVRVPVTDSVSALRVKKVIFSPDGRLLGVKGNTITIWRVADGQQVSNLQGMGVAFSPDGQTLLTGDRLVRLSDGTTLQTYDLTDLSGQVNDIVISADGTLWAAAVVDFSARAFAPWPVYRPIILKQTSNGSVVQQLAGHPTGTWSLAFSPDGRLIASSGHDNTVKLWRIGSTRSWRLRVAGGILGVLVIGLLVWVWRRVRMA